MIGYPALYNKNKKVPKSRASQRGMKFGESDDTDKRATMPTHRNMRKPQFIKPRFDHDLVRLSRTSGLWMSSSASMRSGERSEPHDLGSGERVNYWVGVESDRAL